MFSNRVTSKRILIGILVMLAGILFFRSIRTNDDSASDESIEAQAALEAPEITTDPALNSATPIPTGSAAIAPSEAMRASSGDPPSAPAEARASDPAPPLRTSEMVEARPYTVDASRPRVEQGSALENALPASGLGHTEEPNFGYIGIDVPDPVAFLRTRISLNGGDAFVSSERRRKNEFFRAVEGRGFRGFLLDPNGKVSFARLEVFFAVEGHDALRAYQDKDTFEVRQIALTEFGFWRFDLDQRGIALLQERCPWRSDYTAEKKQFYFVRNGSQLLANVYCGQAQNDAIAWKLVGHYVGEAIP